MKSVRLPIVCLALAAGCSSDDRPAAATDPYKPPLYWSVYEYHIVRQQQVPGADDPTLDPAGTAQNHIPESVLRANVDWVEANLKPHGYTMVAIDGWGDASRLSEHGYRAAHSRQWQHDYAWWSAHLRSRGMKLGMYENPLWVHVPPTDVSTRIVGTDIPVSSLADSGVRSTFRWVEVDRPGAEQYVKGYVAYYAAMGIDHLRIDFVSWFENGFDRNLGRVGRDRPREHYATALRWMREAADRHGVQLSLAMPHLYDEAGLERRYAHGIRISEDIDFGGWWKFSEKDRGLRDRHWSQWSNVADGFAYWSHLTGRDRVRLDGDFIRLNTYATDVERRSVVSMHLVAGGPIAVADRHDTIGDSLRFYRNEEMLALNRDGFVGRPRSNDPTRDDSQVWTGRLSDGDTIVALFNREASPRTRSLSFAELGIPGEASVRDLWQRAPLGSMSAISVDLAPHAAMVLRLSPGPGGCTPQSIRFDRIADVVQGRPAPSLSARASSGLAPTFEVALGPARVEGDRVQPTGEPGIVHVIASQRGDDTWCAAIPAVRAFAVFAASPPR